MSLLDLLVIVVIGASVLTGFLAGFARVGIGFIATLCGVLFGFWFYGIPAGWIHQHIKSATASNLLGFFVVFFAFIFAGALLGKLLSKLFKWTGLSWLDRLMGAAFGFVRGALVAVAFIAVLLAFTPKPMPNWMVNSMVLPYAIDTSNILAAMAPRAIKDAFEDSMNEIRTVWEAQVKKAQKEGKKEAKKSPPPKTERER